MRNPLRRLSSIVLGLIALLGASPAIAQVALPYVPPELYQERRRQQDDQITFCVWDISPTRDLDRQIAEAIGAALLLDVKFYRHTNTILLPEDDFWEQVYIQLAVHCDAILGFALLSNTYPDWLSPSRPYYAGPHLLAVKDERYARLGDIAPGSRIGSVLYTTADVRLIDYLQALPPERRWVRYPFSSPKNQLEQLESRAIAGGIFWAPTLHGLVGGDLAARGIKVVPLDPLAAEPTPVGLIVREHNTRLRAELDRAIQSLAEDGVIARLLRENNLPGDAGPGD